MNIAIAVTDNRAELGKITQGDLSSWRVFNGSFKNVTVSPEELSSLIQHGYAYTTQHNRYRSADNFIQGQHIALDMDTGDERSSIAVLQDDPFISRYASFIHTTPSHTTEHPKARVVFCLDRAIRDVSKYAELAQALVWRFQLADKSCRDAARFFYGSKGCDVAWLGNTLTLQDAARELQDAQAQIDALRAALQPFADMAEHVDGRLYTQGGYVAGLNTVEHYREARRVLDGVRG